MISVVLLVTCGDFRANSGIGEKFEQKRVGLFAVEKMDLGHAAGQRFEGGIDLGIMPLAITPSSLSF
jgi:hypothetical protein